MRYSRSRSLSDIQRAAFLSPVVLHTKPIVVETFVDSSMHHAKISMHPMLTLATYVTISDSISQNLKPQSGVTSMGTLRLLVTPLRATPQISGAAAAAAGTRLRII